MSEQYDQPCEELLQQREFQKRIYGFRIFYKNTRYNRDDMTDGVNGKYVHGYNEEENEEDKKFVEYHLELNKKKMKN